MLKGPFHAKGAQSVFWNEPKSALNLSQLADSVQETLNTIAGEVHLVAHSFAAHTVLKLFEKHAPKKVSKITLIAPAIELDIAHRNILKLAEADFTKMGDLEKANGIAQSLKRAVSLFDSSIQEGFGLAVQDPQLFGNYWTNHEKMGEFFGVWVRENVGLNADNFYGVLKSMGETGCQYQTKLSVPTKVVFGAHDPVAKASEQTVSIERYFFNHTNQVFPNSSHFPHLEKTAEFMDWIMS